MSSLPSLDPEESGWTEFLARGGGDTTIVEGSALYAETPAAIGTPERPEADQISLYVVHSDDSLSEIAQMFGVSVNTILWANDLKRGVSIHEGQVLVILPITGIKHEIAKGDTLATVAKRYHGDATEIATFNNLDPESPLALGLEIIIPNGEAVTPAASLATRPGSGTPSHPGYYIRPLVGGRKSQGIHGYNGVDLAAPSGTPLLAAAAGTVAVSRQGGWNGGYGNYVVIKHSNNTQTLYAHNAKNVVAVGETVSQGQVIGYVGSTGNSTGSHVHFEIRGAKNPF